MKNKEIIDKINIILKSTTKSPITFQLYQKYFLFLKELIENEEQEYYLINTVKALHDANVIVKPEDRETYHEYQLYLNTYQYDSPIRTK